MDLERELQDTKNYYQAKLGQLERYQKLMSSNQNQSDFIASFGQPLPQMSYGERQRYLEQISLVELERDEARREAQILDIENRLLANSLKQNIQ